jgi:hypothetical protein
MLFQTLEYDCHRLGTDPRPLNTDLQNHYVPSTPKTDYHLCLEVQK